MLDDDFIVDLSKQFYYFIQKGYSIYISGQDYPIIEFSDYLSVYRNGGRVDLYNSKHEFIRNVEIGL